MRIAHLDEPCFCVTSIPIPHPFSSTGFGTTGFPVLVEGGYRLRHALLVEALFSNTPIGSTNGYHAPVEFLDVHYGVTSVAALLSLGNRGFQFGAGPALHVVHAAGGGDSGRLPPQSNETKIGWIVQGRAELPARSRFFVNLALNYSFVGSAVVGPFTTAFSDAQATSTNVILPATRIGYNHWFAGIGPGVRF
jgi:hypothetical protein